MIRQLAKSVRQYWKYAILTPVLMIGEVAMEVLIPLLMAEIIDNGVYTGDMDYILRLSILLIASALLSLSFGAAGARTAAVASCGFATNLRHDIFYHIQDFSFHNIDSFSTSSLITRLTTDVQNVQMAFQMMIRICFRSPIMFIFALVMVVRQSPTLALVFAIAIPVTACAIGFLVYTTYPIFGRVFKSYDRLNQVTEENLTGIRTVKAYVREEEEIRKFDVTSKAIRDDFVLAQKLMALSQPVMQTITYICILIISYIGARLISGGSMQTGQLMSIFTYTMQILMSLMMMAMIVVMLSISKASGDRIAQVLNTTSDMDPNENGLKVVPDGSVSFDNVSFSYGGASICLDSVDIDVKSGETIGILGATGAGKSTLVSLIARLYDVTSGSVKVGGHDVREYSLEALRSQVSVVLQKNQLFSGTIRSNLLWGDEKASDEELEEALRSASADFVFSEKDGLDAVVEQGGSNFSGGQKQRLCIARALVKKPKVLIFDDSTSAVDTATDLRIREALANTSPGVTKFIIAQRVSSVMESDRIIILDSGRVQDVGTHDELLARNRIYQGLVKVQMEGRENA